MALVFVDEAELRTMLGRGKHVVVDFFANWWAPCHLLTPELEKLASRMGDEVEFVKIDVDENPGLALSLEIMTIPTVIYFSDGAEIARSVGAVGPGELATRLMLEG
ncbi:MAG: thioredoxin family protein [Actinomycetota bacterium]